MNYLRGCLFAGLLFASFGTASAQPCRPYVPPIRSTTSVIVITVNGWTGFTLEADRSLVLAYLNARGLDDGNSFRFAEAGQSVNLYLTYSIRNSGRDHFAGSLELAGWGQGWIATVRRDNWYDSATDLLTQMADEAYTWIHNGWHDPRPQCSTE